MVASICGEDFFGGGPADELTISSDTAALVAVICDDREESDRVVVDLPPENWSTDNESPHGWGSAPRRTGCVAAGLRRSRLLVF